jgi:hypothetical protein
MSTGATPAPPALETYLNDHLGGATGACELARNAAEKFAGTPHGNFLVDFLGQVEQDRATLEKMITELGGTPSPLKQAGAWIMEKVSRLKLSPAGSEPDEMSALLTLETLSIGVEGKICLWEGLRDLADMDGRLKAFDFDGLLGRAGAQRTGLEQERLAASRKALAPTVSSRR